MHISTDQMALSFFFICARLIPKDKDKTMVYVHFADQLHGIITVWLDKMMGFENIAVHDTIAIFSWNGEIRDLGEAVAAVGFLST